MSAFQFFFIIYALLSQATSGPIAEGDTKFLGNIILSGESPPSNFANYWNQVTCENEGKWGNAELSRDQFSWGGIDAAYNYAKNKGFPFKHHCFFWDLQKPNWMGGLSAADQKAEAEEWIMAYANRYPQTEYIDVVNEPRDHTPTYSNALGGKGETGWDWIVWAFETARKYCPKAKLLINEHNVEANMTNALLFRNIIVILHERKLVDGVGIQCHAADIQRNNASLDTIKRCIDTLASVGLPMYPSELDLEGDDQQQLADYKRIFPYIWEHPGTKGVTLWGYQGNMWTTNAVLIKNGVERPALKWLRTYVDSIKNNKITHTNKKSSTETNPIMVNYSRLGRIEVHLSSMQEYAVRIIDPRGRIIASQMNHLFTRETHTIVFPTLSLCPGLYIVNAKSRQLCLTKKFILGF